MTKLLSAKMKKRGLIVINVDSITNDDETKRNLKITKKNFKMNVELAQLISLGFDFE